MLQPCPTELRSRTAFRHWTQVPLRYADLDPLGHVNNAAIPMCLEQARVAIIYPLMVEHGAGALELVIGRVLIDYLREVSYPGTIEVGTRIARVGTKSIETEHGIFMAGSDVCSGAAMTVLVLFDVEARRAAAMPEALRVVLASLG